MEPELIADYACRCGEGPLWHPDERCVYWVDIPAGRLYRYEPCSGGHGLVHEGEVVGGFTLQADGSLLLFGDKGSVRVWRDGKLTTIIDALPGEETSRFNDVIADPVGRVYCGTMAASDSPGRLYLLDLDGSWEVLLEGVGCSNGLGFTPDRRQLYYTDSRAHTIYLFDYHEATGAITNKRLFVRTPDAEGVPDGMTVDAEGFVWTAKWDGGCLVRLRPDGTEERRVRFPARKVSCVTFGGDGYTDLYVTCAGGEAKATEGPGAGALFRLDLGIKGVPEFRSRIGL